MVSSKSDISSTFTYLFTHNSQLSYLLTWLLTRCEKRDLKDAEIDKTRCKKTRCKSAKIAETRDVNAPCSYAEITKIRHKKRDEKTQKSAKRDAQNTMQTRRNR